MLYSKFVSKSFESVENSMEMVLDLYEGKYIESIMALGYAINTRGFVEGDMVMFKSIADKLVELIDEFSDLTTTGFDLSDLFGAKRLARNKEYTLKFLDLLNGLEIQTQYESNELMVPVELDTTSFEAFINMITEDLVDAGAKMYAFIKDTMINGVSDEFIADYKSAILGVFQDRNVDGVVEMYKHIFIDYEADEKIVSIIERATILVPKVQTLMTVPQSSNIHYIGSDTYTNYSDLKSDGVYYINDIQYHSLEFYIGVDLIYTISYTDPENIQVRTKDVMNLQKEVLNRRRK